MKHCCPMMKLKLEQTCEKHSRDCVDVVMVTMKNGRHAIPIHDGGSSGIVISFCPWCGADLDPRIPGWLKWLQDLFR